MSSRELMGCVFHSLTPTLQLAQNKGVNYLQMDRKVFCHLSFYWYEFVLTTSSDLTENTFPDYLIGPCQMRSQAGETGHDSFFGSF